MRSTAPAQSDVANALDQIEQALVGQRDNLNALAGSSADSGAIAQLCSVTLDELYAVMSNLGFLHRAQHPCNAFEAYDPLRRLAQDVIGMDTRIVVSSEWDFSPHTIVSLRGLPEFVFVGLPASESDNAFLLPLAGHEIGHSLWRRLGEEKKYLSRIVDELLKQIRSRWPEFKAAFVHVRDQGTLATDPNAVSAWKPAWLSARRQSEEIFCDLIGLRLFGEAYLKAFAWLIAPGLDGGRSMYPSAPARARILAEASESWGISVPNGFEDQFHTIPGGSTLLLLELADATASALASELTQGANDVIDSRNIGLPNEDVVKSISSRLLLAGPSVVSATLQELLCGAWRLRDLPDLWASYPHLARDRERILNELLLKSAQCLEWRKRVEAVA